MDFVSEKDARDSPLASMLTSTHMAMCTHTWALVNVHVHTHTHTHTYIFKELVEEEVVHAGRWTWMEGHTSLGLPGNPLVLHEVSAGNLLL